ncbi:unnamed protein product [Linum tenue]|uniref:TIR domain-containing protein n=1 Tax=Linum tenue TaxID=586396 RepID=A0AAV0L3L4_9ROSI|nr:unnamed protein product [Linum tenue]
MDRKSWIMWLIVSAVVGLLLAVAIPFFTKSSSKPLDDSSSSKSESSMEQQQASAAPSSSPMEYEVFLSFRGPDVRNNFGDFLYTFLVRENIRTFRDDEELPKGEKIDPALIKAIEESKVYIPIFSPDYAGSKSCLQELAQMLKCCKQEKDHIILPIFFMTEPGDVRRQEGAYKEPFKQLIKKKKLDAGTIKEFEEALREVGKLKGWHVTKSDGQGAIAKEVVEKVRKHLDTSYTLVTDELVGIDSHVEEVTNLLNLGYEGVKIVGIYGMAGIGKTTIAKAVYNKVRGQLDYYCFVEDVREILLGHDGVINLQSKIISGILRTDHKVKDAKEGIRVIKERVFKRKVLIVLDDVDDRFRFNQTLGNLDDFFPKSRFIITTRNKRVLEFLGESKLYEPREMSHDHALQLFSKHAFRTDNPPKEEAVLSKKFVTVATGHPLTLKVFGSLLFHRDRIFWEAKLIELKDIPPTEVLERLKISYNDLEYNVRQIFLDISCSFIGEKKDFPEYMWSDCNFHPVPGIRTLVDRSLLKLNERNEFWMHDLIRDLGRTIIREEDNLHPWKRSRIWSNVDALDLLESEEGSDLVEVLRVNMAETDLELTDKNFKKLSGLRYLEVHNGRLTGDFRGILPHVRWLRLHECSSVPSDLNLKKLVILDMHGCPVEDGWGGWSGIKAARKLKAINLSFCGKLRTAPDLSQCRSLEFIHFWNCWEMSGELHIGNFKNLTVLSLTMTEITKLTGNIGRLKNLQAIDSGHLIESQEVVVVLPTSLKHLSLSSSQVPNLSELQDLEELSFERCDQLEIPGDIWKMSKLKTLELRDSSFSNSGMISSTLPSSLNSLLIHGCEPLVRLPSVLERLKVTYNDLSYNEQQIFLDIACSFIGEKREFPFYLWSDCNLYPVSGISTLVHRSLIKFDERNEFWMHDLIRDLGRSIIREEDNQHPWKRSRILSNEDALDILEREEAARKLKAINLSFCGKLRTAPDLSQCRILEFIHFWYCGEMSGELHIGNFKNLKVLSLFITEITKLTGDIGRHKTLQEINAGDLTEEVGAIVVLPTSLKKLSLSSPRVPNLSELKDLEELSFEGGDQVEIPGDIWKLSKLKKLELRPTSFSNSGVISSTFPSSLNSLLIHGSEPLERLPTLANLNNLKELSLMGIQIREIQGLGDLAMLETLVIDGAPNLIHLNGLENLLLLKTLKVEGCDVLEKLPSVSNLTKLELLEIVSCRCLSEIQGIGELGELSLATIYIVDCPAESLLHSVLKLTRLRELYLYDTYGDHLSSRERFLDLSGLRDIETLLISGFGELTTVYGLEKLESLTSLSMVYCTSMRELPDLSGLKNLKNLSIGGCTQLMDITELERSELLETLDMSGCKSIRKLPDLSGLRNLEKLIIDECTQLTEVAIIESSESLTSLSMVDCSSIAQLPDLSRLKNLNSLEISRCTGLTEVVGLEMLDLLEFLFMSGCSSIKELPDLSGLDSIVTLDISECTGLTEVVGLKNLESLQQLKMANFKIKKLPDLSGLKHLHELDIMGCVQLAEVTGIENLEGLTIMR